jgi:hypothetical protein
MTLPPGMAAGGAPDSYEIFEMGFSMITDYPDAIA